MTLEDRQEQARADRDEWVEKRGRWPKRIDWVEPRIIGEGQSRVKRTGTTDEQAGRSGAAPVYR